MGAGEVAAQSRRRQEPRELIGPERAMLELVVKLLDHLAALGDPEVDRGVERRPRPRHARVDVIAPELPRADRGVICQAMDGLRPDAPGVIGITREDPARAEEARHDAQARGDFPVRDQVGEGPARAGDGVKGPRGDRPQRGEVPHVAQEEVPLRHAPAREGDHRGREIHAGVGIPGPHEVPREESRPAPEVEDAPGPARLEQRVVAREILGIIVNDGVQGVKHPRERGIEPAEREQQRGTRLGRGTRNPRGKESLENLAALAGHARQGFPEAGSHGLQAPVNRRGRDLRDGRDVGQADGGGVARGKDGSGNDRGRAHVDFCQQEFVEAPPHDPGRDLHDTGRGMDPVQDGGDEARCHRAPVLAGGMFRSGSQHPVEGAQGPRPAEELDESRLGHGDAGRERLPVGDSRRQQVHVPGAGPLGGGAIGPRERGHAPVKELALDGEVEADGKGLDCQVPAQQALPPVFLGHVPRGAARGGQGWQN